MIQKVTTELLYRLLMAVITTLKDYEDDQKKDTQWAKTIWEDESKVGM